MKPTILLATPLPPPADAVLKGLFVCHRLPGKGIGSGASEVMSDVRGIATFNFADEKLIESLPLLEIIASCTVGVDGIDLAAARRRNIVVTNTPDVLTDCVAETALGLTLNVLHRFPRAEAWLRNGDWERRGPFPLAAELRGKTMGILGLGRIGEAIALRARAFGMQIRYHNRQQKDCGFPYDSDAALLAENSDVLMVVTPGGPATQSLVDKRVLEALGPEGYLINISRGSVVDEPALLLALKERRIAGAGLDVFWNEPNIDPALFSLENAVLLPHIGSATVETRAAMSQLMIENLRRHFTGMPLLTSVQS